MVGILSAKCRKCRREREKLFLKGDRCFTPKCAMVKKSYPPGLHGKKISRNSSEYGKQLREKQKVKKIYGILEKQFKNYFKAASKERGVTGKTMIMKLEKRLDNVIFRLGIAKSRRAARQAVSHGHIAVERSGKKRKVNIPSFEVKIGDKIYVAEKSKKKGEFKNLDHLKSYTFPSWLAFDANSLMGEVISDPSKEDANINADMQLIVELYAR